MMNIYTDYDEAREEGLLLRPKIQAMGIFKAPSSKEYDILNFIDEMDSNSQDNTEGSDTLKCLTNQAQGKR